MIRTVSLGLLGACMALVACASLQPSYSIQIKNSTGVRIDEASVDWDDFRSGHGSMSPGVRKGYNFLDLPLPERVTVRWRTQDGVTHRQEVDLPEDLPRRFQGTLHFELLEDGQVELRVER